MKALNPYTHTCHIPAGAGHDPNQCPACQWAEQQQPQDPTRTYFGAMGIHFNNKGQR